MSVGVSGGSVFGLGVAGLTGAVLVELVEVALYQRREDRLPWVAVRGWVGATIGSRRYPSTGTYALAVLGKIVFAFLLVALLTWGEQVSGTLGALVVGAAVAVVLSRAAALLPVGGLPGAGGNAPPREDLR